MSKWLTLKPKDMVKQPVEIMNDQDLIYGKY